MKEDEDGKSKAAQNARCAIGCTVKVDLGRTKMQWL
jgi:hypothetical protein